MNGLRVRLAMLLRRLARPFDRCARHRDTLLDVFDEGAVERGVDPAFDRAVDAALDHLGRCRACESELGDLALVIAGLRRLGAAARHAQPPAGGWLRLRRRLQAQRAPVLRASLAPLAGLIAVPIVIAMALSPGADGTSRAMLDAMQAPETVAVATGAATSLPPVAAFAADAGGLERGESAAMASVLFRHGYPTDPAPPVGMAPVRPEFLPQ